MVLTASHLVPDHACAFADNNFAHDGPARDVSPHIEAVARVLAAIRLWPELPPTGPATAECAALAVTCLELDVVESHRELLIQAAQALSRPELNPQMCALSQAWHSHQRVFDSSLRPPNNSPYATVS